MTDYETIHRLHMQDMKRLNERAEDRKESQFIAGLTLFYLCVLILAIIVW